MLIEFRPGVFARVGEVSADKCGRHFTFTGDRWVWVGGDDSVLPPPELRAAPTTGRRRQRTIAFGWDWKGLDRE